MSRWIKIRLKCANISIWSFIFDFIEEDLVNIINLKNSLLTKKIKICSFIVFVCYIILNNKKKKKEEIN